MQLSRWKFVILWQVTGMLCALSVSAVGALIGNLRIGAGSIDSALSIPRDIAVVIAGVLLITPLSLLTLWVWVWARVRYPVLEPSFGRAVLHLCLAALVLALAAGAISNWELLRFDADRETFLHETLAVARSVLFWSLLGVVLPRILVRPLQPRPTAP